MLITARGLKNILFLFSLILLICAFLFIISTLEQNSYDYLAEAYNNSDFYVNLTPQEYEYNATPQSFVVDIKYNNEDFDDYTVNYFKDGSTERLDEPPTNANSYDVEIFVDEYNNWRTSLIITPKPITVNYAGPYEYTYSGLRHGRTITAIGVISPDDVGLQIQYEGINNLVPVNEIPTNVDDYVITVTLSNQNYSIGLTTGEEVGKLLINKANLIARAEDVIIKPGETPRFNIVYTGFVSGEDESNLKEKPTIVFEESDPGKYPITPRGGISSNYKFVYEEGTAIIDFDKIETTIEDHTFTVIAFFDPDFDLQVSKITSSDDAFNTANEIIKNRGMDTYMDKVIYAFDTSQSTGISRDTKYKIQISNIKFNDIFAYKLFIVDELGLVHEIKKFSRNGDTISFTTPELGTIFVVEMQLRTYLIIGISVGVCIVIIAFFIFTYVKYLMEKKNIDERNRKRRNKTRYKWN
ncbi:MAG TPA: MBG domain-containing protein [Clostridia bacterium]|jgi:hypothetical protein|nr:MBG domain-containing protein [Clostridia bacterium]